MPARYVAVAEVFEGVSRARGWERGREVVVERRGKAYDPAVAECLAREAEPLFALLDQPSVWDAALDAEPSPRAGRAGSRRRT